jgi:hypothetical protein
VLDGRARVSACFALREFARLSQTLDFYPDEAVFFVFIDHIYLFSINHFQHFFFSVFFKQIVHGSESDEASLCIEMYARDLQSATNTRSPVDVSQLYRLTSIATLPLSSLRKDAIAQAHEVRFLISSFSASFSNHDLYLILCHLTVFRSRLCRRCCQCCLNSPIIVTICYRWVGLRKHLNSHCRYRLLFCLDIVLCLVQVVHLFFDLCFLGVFVVSQMFPHAHWAVQMHQIAVMEQQSRIELVMQAGKNSFFLSIYVVFASLNLIIFVGCVVQRKRRLNKWPRKSLRRNAQNSLRPRLNVLFSIYCYINHI